MASPIIAVRKAALARLQTSLAEDVLDAAPLVYVLPYVTFFESGLADVQRHNKSNSLNLIEVTFDVVTDPHDADSKSADDLADEVDAAMAAALTPAGFTVRAQALVELRSFFDFDEAGAEIKRSRMRWQLDVL